MIGQLDVRNFKGFETFSVRFKHSTFLSGPNSAGKSTLLAALRTASQLQKIALSRVADRRVEDLSSAIPAWSFTAEQARLNVENIRHEFRDQDSSIRIRFSNGSQLKAVWTKGELVPSEGWFYFQDQAHTWLSRPAEVRREVPSLGFVPLLTPIEQEERVLQAKTVRSNFDTRLSSRHFRNQLNLLDESAGLEGQTEFEDFKAFAAPWVPELSLRDLARRGGGDGLYLDLFYLEEGSSREKEIYWIGDGMQIWLQLLLHLFRMDDESTIVLDEPDVYLHADLQRRLVRLLDSFGSQTITATHSAEVLAEAEPTSIAWVSRNRPRAVSGTGTAQMAELSAEIGSQFNIRLARALKAKAVLFVEGEDTKILTNLPATCGAESFANELGLAVIPLNGFDNWSHVEPFAWFANNLLEGSVPVHVLLDRDYRPDAAVESVLQRLTDAGVNGHVWDRKELESYLLVFSCMAQVSGATESQIEAWLEDLTQEMEATVSARLLQECIAVEVDGKNHQVSVTERFNEDFKKKWKSSEFRIQRCPPKALLSGLNRDLVGAGNSSLSVHSLSKNLRLGEIPSEMRNVIAGLEEALT